MKNDLSYQQRLGVFNSSEKYKSEMEFLVKLMSPFNKNEDILDYGCGLGTLIEYLKKNFNLNTYGYDINDYLPNSLNKFKINELTKKYSKIVFMHSLAHIPNVEIILNNLHNNLKQNGNIYVITPNLEFDNHFRKMKDLEYKPDETVVKHFNSAELFDLFKKCGYQVCFCGNFGKIVENIHERCFLIASK